jgi:hypothetical protein
MSSRATHIVDEVQSVPENTTEESTSGGRSKAVHRLNLVVSAGSYRELMDLAAEQQTSMKEIIRIAIGFIKIVLREKARGRRVIVVDQSGRAEMELVLPV